MRCVIVKNIQIMFPYFCCKREEGWEVGKVAFGFHKELKDNNNVSTMQLGNNPCLPLSITWLVGVFC